MMASKGATSGQTYDLVEAVVNCEQNSLLYIVKPLGHGACHTRGADGKARVTIERLTETFIVIYGKTISIIGTTERTLLARRAIETLLDGSTHAAVYKWLEKSAKQVRKKEGFGL